MRNLQMDGFLGRDCETKTGAKGEFVVFSLCTNTYVKGEQKSIWYNCTIFDTNKFKSIIPYLKKGKYLFISGTPNEELYTAKDGSVKIDYSINIDTIHFLNSGQKKDGNETSSESSKNYNEPKMTPYQAPAEPQVNYSQNYSEPEVSYENLDSNSGSDDDLPF